MLATPSRTETSSCPPWPVLETLFCQVLASAGESPRPLTLGVSAPAPRQASDSTCASAPHLALGRHLDVCCDSSSLSNTVFSKRDCLLPACLCLLPVGPVPQGPLPKSLWPPGAGATSEWNSRDHIVTKWQGPASPIGLGQIKETMATSRDPFL